MTASRDVEVGAEAGAHRSRWAGSRDVLLELGFVAVALACYLAVRWYTLPRLDEATANARDVLGVERALGMNWERAVQDATMALPPLNAFFTQVYVWGYFPVLLAAMVWLFLRHRDSYRRLRNLLLASGAAGMLVYAFFPCAPPWMGGNGFTDTVTGDSLGEVARPSAIANLTGAMPSFHVGWLMLAGVVVFEATRSFVLRVLCVVLPLLMAYAVVSTGNHWVLDIPAGLVLAGLTLAAVGYVGQVWPPRPEGVRSQHPVSRRAGRG
ncbi:MAG TPA: phosphatase PAP2 family protein [Marmoricola sp.]|nr:phosphatase PAP2 family protein [Marmoricola sp.]